MQRQGWRFGNICRASALFYRMKISFPYDKKRSARIALRRKGIVSLMRPAAGLRILRSRILFYRMKTSFPYDKKRSARIALGARADGCRSNRASARECAKAHSLSYFIKYNDLSDVLKKNDSGDFNTKCRQDFIRQSKNLKNNQ